EQGRSVVALQEVPIEQISSKGAAACEPVADGLVRIVDIVEKPAVDEAPSNLAAAGRYVLTPEIFDALSHTEPGALGEIQLTDAIRSLALMQAVYGYLYEGRWFDTGLKLDYLRASVEIASEREDLGEDFRAFLSDFVQRRKLV
ncbi:MAG: sugar phosphate nucleotidyltransferase, partial [Actinomycetota bacterium]